MNLVDDHSGRAPPGAAPAPAPAAAAPPGAGTPPAAVSGSTPQPFALDPIGDRRCRPRDVFGQDLITPAVAAELRITGPEPDLALFDGQEDLAAALVEGWLCLSEPGLAEPYHPLNPGVDAGEASCIALALGRRQRCLESLLTPDDRAGRAEARRLDLELTGTAAVVAMARLRGLIPAAGPVLLDLCSNGYFLGEATVELLPQCLRLAAGFAGSSTPFLLLPLCPCSASRIYIFPLDLRSR